jgi:hypothetical protein
MTINEAFEELDRIGGLTLIKTDSVDGTPMRAAIFVSGVPLTAVVLAALKDLHKTWGSSLPEGKSWSGWLPAGAACDADTYRKVMAGEHQEVKPS